MKGVKYATVRNEKHTITVRTWRERKGPGSRVFEDHYRFVLDGKILDEGTLADPKDEG
jgi:hypothetical protein